MDAIIAKLPSLIVITVRVGAAFMAVPFFNQRLFSSMVKLAFAFLVSLLLLPVAPAAGWPLPGSLPGLVALLLQEMVVGLAIGLVVLLLLAALEMVGQLLSFHMAFSMATVFDPTLGASGTVISAILVMLGTLLLLMLDGDRYLLNALAGSFRALPPGRLLVGAGVIELFNRMLTHALTIGFQLAAPVVILLLAVDFTLSLISKTAAKMQIFFVGMPLKVALGLVGISLLLGVMLTVWTREVEGLPAWFSTLFLALRGGHG